MLLRPERVQQYVGNVPYMRMQEALIFYDLIMAHELRSILQLGVGHGVSTAYLAGAIEQIGSGCVTTIDLETAKNRSPNLKEIISACGLQGRVEMFFEPATFNSKLMMLLEERICRRFDLCYIESGHTWTEVGLAFCLLRYLLRPGGWVVLNDIPYTFRTSRNHISSRVLQLPEEEQVTPQVERVFTLLVMRDNNFDTFRRIGRFGFARKRDQTSPDSSADLLIENQVCAAASLARKDPHLRQRLLLYPASTMHEISGHDEARFHWLRFAESNLWSPLKPDCDENGILTHFLELPSWEKSFREEDIMDLMRDVRS